MALMMADVALSRAEPSTRVVLVLRVGMLGDVQVDDVVDVGVDVVHG